jgi:hypothetical protein
MNIKTLQGYMCLCRYYGWAPTWDGLRAFARGDRRKFLNRGEYIMPAYDPCEKCKSGFPVKVCSQFCHAFKWAQERDVQRRLDEVLFHRLERIAKL